MLLLARVLCMVAVTFASARLAAAADHAAIAPYLTDDVGDVAFVDLTRIDFTTLFGELARLGLLPEAEPAALEQHAAALQKAYAELPKLGAERAYVLFRVSDVSAGGLTWIVTVKQGGNPAEVATFLNNVREKLAPEMKRSWGDVLAGYVLPKAFVAVSETIVAAGNEEQVARVKELGAKPPAAGRVEAIAALEALGDADAGLAVFGDPDSRRVVREMFPQMPAPFMEIDGKLLADGVRSAGVAVTFPPKLQLSVIVDATNPETAATLEQSFGKAMTLAKTFLLKESLSGPLAHQERARSLLPLVALVHPQLEGQRLSVVFGDDAEEVTFVRDFLPAITQKVRTEAARHERMNKFKHLALGMLNYESARGSLPAAASRDAQGRPLLSWRVHILPYMDQMELYKQFHLDEPWDSEHNRKLIDQMPEVYADPDSAVQKAIGDVGRTTFVVPVGEGLLFGGPEGRKYNEIKDGTSATILAVEVVPERAVVWTKPDDWQVDAKDPLAGVRRSDRDYFTTAYCDGHVKIHQNDIASDLFRALLTPAGGEVIDQNQIK